MTTFLYFLFVCPELSPKDCSHTKFYHFLWFLVLVTPQNKNNFCFFWLNKTCTSAENSTKSNKKLKSTIKQKNMSLSCCPLASWKLQKLFCFGIEYFKQILRVVIDYIFILFLCLLWMVSKSSCGVKGRQKQKKS